MMALALIVSVIPYQSRHSAAKSYSRSHEGFCQLAEVVVDRFVLINQHEKKPVNVNLVHDTNGRSIFDICPSAQPRLPDDFIVVAPRPHRGPDLKSPGFGFDPNSFVYKLGVPKLIDATQAKISFVVSCDGLCGGGSTEIFIFNKGRWHWLRRSDGWVS